VVERVRAELETLIDREARARVLAEEALARREAVERLQVA
jgi:hypothetical protein